MYDLPAVKHKSVAKIVPGLWTEKPVWNQPGLSGVSRSSQADVNMWD